MEKIRLHYFDIWGRAEMIRILLHHAKVEYENVIIDGEGLNKLRAEGAVEFEQIPMLEIGDKKYVQSTAILRLLGRKYGYYPSDVEEAYWIDSFMDSIEDTLKKFLQVKYEKDELEKTSKGADLIGVYLPKWLGAIEKRLADNAAKGNSKHLVGDKYTIADFVLGSFINSIFFNDANEISKPSRIIYEMHENLMKFKESFNKDFEEYLKARPQPRPI